MNIIALASIPLQTSITCAIAGGVLEGAFMKWGIRYIDRKIGDPLNRWIDYPQSLAAGLVALSVLGTGGMGCAALAGFAVLPIVCKTIESFTPQQSWTYKRAENADHLIRIAAKMINVAAATYIFVHSQPLGESLQNLFKAFSLTVFLVKDASNMGRYHASSEKNFYFGIIVWRHCGKLNSKSPISSPASLNGIPD